MSNNNQNPPKVSNHLAFSVPYGHYTTSQIFSATALAGIAGSTSGSGGSSNTQHEGRVNQQEFLNLCEKHENLSEAYEQLKNAFKALVVEHRALMDRVDQITKALGGQQTNGPVVSSGQYRPTGYYDET